jgi:hypothetical protein
MRSKILVIVAIALVMGGAALAGQLKGGARMNKAIVEFTEQVKLQDVILKGEYIFIHDDEKMAQGLDCTYVYTNDKGRPGKLVTSFHCIPVQRDNKADQFTVIVEWNAATNLAELVEYRFAGDNEGHKVPKPADKH